MLLYIVRHGHPDYATDTLTQRGWLQAESVGKRIAASGINAIYASPMGRARQTAEPACRLLGLTCRIEHWAHEIEDERLTAEPYGKPVSVTIVQNTYYREKGGKKMKAMGFEITSDMMSMMNGFTVLRLFPLMGGMMDVKFTKEQLLALNAQLNQIPKAK